MAGRLPDTRRNRLVTARRGEDGEQESLETKDGDQESLEIKERIKREWRLGGQSKSAMWGQRDSTGL